MPEWSWKVLSLGVAGLIGYFSGQVSAEQRITRIETRLDERYTALMQRIDDVGSRTRQGHDEIRMDLEGIRSEIMNILRERRR